MTPYLQDADFTLWNGDVLGTLAGMESESVNCVVTSPPYWGLRDYGTGSWEGGNPGCEHAPVSGIQGTSEASLRSDRTFTGSKPQGQTCGRCGARRIDQQLGLEPTPEEYIARMVEVFREVRRVLRRDGTCWVNIGDSYAGHNLPGWRDGNEAKNGGVSNKNGVGYVPGMKPKDLVGIPWRLAFALQQDGWYLRADIIWSKPNPMPESVTDRPTKAHEYVFLLTKSARYWFDQEAVRERYGDPEREWWNETTTAPGNPNRNDGGGLQSRPARRPDGRRRTGVLAGDGSIQHRDGERWPNLNGRNIRSVWEIATQPYPEAHFATYPEELVRRCVLAGCPEWVCGTCGKPRDRIVEDSPEYATAKADLREKRSGMRSNDLATFGLSQGTGTPNPSISRAAQTLGFTDCGHNNYQPGVVLDPFCGSGTTAVVARKHNRRCVGIELNPAYCELAARRTQQLTLGAA